MKEEKLTWWQWLISLIISILVLAGFLGLAWLFIYIITHAAKMGLGL